MINEENLSKLYNGVLEETELTTKTLNGYGFNSKDLNELIQEGSIERLKRGLYSLKSVNKLFKYGKKLIANKEYEKATLCFEKCFELDPTHLGACFQLFLRSIQNEDYKRAFELYEKLIQSKNEFYAIDANYYIYLLSIITEVPEKYREYARYLKFDDIKIPSEDKRYEDITLQNRVRISVLKRKFPYALKQLKDLIAKHGNITVQDMIAKTLLLQAENAEKTSKNTIISLIQEKKYNEVVKHLLDKQRRHNLSISEEYILKLVRQLIEIQETLKIPKIEVTQAKNVFEAIDTNNYNLALRLSDEYNERNHISNNNNVLNLLLSEICTLINTLSKPKKVEVTKEEQPTIAFNEPNQSVTTFSAIISCLMKNELDNAFYNLRSYMQSIGKSDLEFLIIDLIKISLLEKDAAFTKPMIALTLISKGNYSFDVSSYFQEFYIALSQNRFEEARIYLDIISKADKFGQGCIMIDGLYQALESSEKILNYKRDNSVLMPVEKAIKDNKQERFADTSVASSNSKEQTNQTKQIQTKPVLTFKRPEFKQNESLQEKRDSEKAFISKKHEELVEKKGIILLRPIDDARIDRIFDMVKEYPDMVAFVIGEENKRQVVLRYKPRIKEYTDVKNLIDFGNQAYKDGNYNECINNYLQLLQTVAKTRAINYSKLGLSYMKKGNIPLAIDYLTIATELSKKEHNSYDDYTGLILRLKGETSKADAKPMFRMREKDFDYSDVNSFYGIANFEEIDSYIVESGLDVESACQQMGMTPEQIDIIRLIYAREFYIQGNFEKGDLFLVSVEKSKNKTKITKNLLEEVRKNKRFYQHRDIKKTRKLALTLVPKKSNKNSQS